MRRNDRMQKVVMGTLATMLVASLVLAVASFVWPTPVHAEHYCYITCKWIGQCMFCCTKECCDAYRCWTIWSFCEWYC